VTLEGIDTSKWQGRADWAGAARATGFAIAKATQGTTEVDPNYLPALAAFRAAGKPRGSYHYADGGDPEAEAAFYVEHNARANGEIQVLDFESVGVLQLADPVGWAYMWCAEVNALSGNLPLIYMNSDTLHRFGWERLVALNVGLWVASWGDVKPDPGAWPFLICWQHTDAEKLTGIPANVDGDTFYGDAGVWQRYGSNRGAPVPPVPPAHPVPAPAPAPQPTHATAYTVVAGDNLTTIGHRFGVSVAALVAANEHKYASLGWHPDYIGVGWVLAIPGAHPAPAPAHVTVKAGDNLSAIAAAHGLTLARIEALNPQFAPNFDHIEPGDQVRIA